jgi:cytochrome c-type biogenesis protein CcmE
VTPRAKRRAIIAASVCVAAVVTIVVLGVVLSKNVVYFRTVSEAVDQRPDEADNRLRVAGEVVPGTVAETGQGVRFDITDGRKTIAVVHQGDPPGLFKDGAPVVCEGNWGKGAAFDSDRILIKHGNEYKPPDVDDTKARS